MLFVLVIGAQIGTREAHEDRRRVRGRVRTDAPTLPGSQSGSPYPCRSRSTDEKKILHIKGETNDLPWNIGHPNLFPSVWGPTPRWRSRVDYCVQKVHSGTLSYRVHPLTCVCGTEGQDHHSPDSGNGGVVGVGVLPT